MVGLDVARAANKSLVQRQPLVAVFFGGTGGIGSYTLRVLAKNEAEHAGKGLRAYIVGRNAASAEAIISECRDIYPQGEYYFFKAEDLSLLPEVDRVCKEITQAEEAKDHGRIDFLVLSQGGSIFLPRTETKEGIDITMALMYYYRMRIITQLLPLLLKSPKPASVASVYAAGSEAKLFPDDLSLRDLTVYTYLQARSHMNYMHTLFMEDLAKRNGGRLALSHYYPGIVPGPGYDSPDLPLWFRRLFRWVLKPIFGRFFIQPDDSGNRVLSLASPRYPARSASGGVKAEDVAIGTDGKPGSGVYSLDSVGDNNLPAEMYAKFDRESMTRKVWEHTWKAFEVVQSGKVFTE